MKHAALLIVVATVFLTVSSGIEADAAPMVFIDVNQTAFDAGDNLFVTLTTMPGLDDNLWDIYVALILPDNTVFFFAYQPSLVISPAPIPARPLAQIASESLVILNITLPPGLPAGGWRWAAAPAKPNLSEIGQISWAPFTVSGVQAVDVSGTWEGFWRSSQGPGGSFSSRITQDGTTLSGTIDIPFLSMSNALLAGSILGNSITFGDIAGQVTFTGTISHETTASGTYVFNALSDSGTWQGFRITSPPTEPPVPPGPPGDSCISIAGTWNTTETIISDNCDDTPSARQNRYTVSQDGCSVTGNDGRGTYTGSITGTILSWTGSFPDSGGTTRIASSSLTISNNGMSMSGTLNWTWSNGSTSCSGTTQVSGTRVP